MSSIQCGDCAKSDRGSESEGAKQRVFVGPRGERATMGKWGKGKGGRLGRAGEGQRQRG